MNILYYYQYIHIFIIYQVLVYENITSKVLEQKLENILNVDDFTEEVIREREEISEQIKALNDLKKMAEKYGFDISVPATNAKEAVQWLYFGYLGAIKTKMVLQ